MTEGERDRLTGTFDERVKIATVAMAPSVVMFYDNSSGDTALVDSMCPHDYTLKLWRFIVEHHSRKQIASMRSAMPSARPRRRSSSNSRSRDR
jgi:hypothetical protein